MEKVVNIVEMKDESKKNNQFWLNRTVEERLSAIQILREQYITFFNKHGEYNESRKRLRRVFRVIKRSES